MMPKKLDFGLGFDSLHAMRNIDDICFCVSYVVGPNVLKNAHTMERANISNVCTHGKIKTTFTPAWMFIWSKNV